MGWGIGNKRVGGIVVNGEPGKKGATKSLSKMWGKNFGEGRARENKGTPKKAHMGVTINGKGWGGGGGKGVG